MKLTREPRRTKNPRSRELLEIAGPNEPLPFDPEKDISPRQKEIMLSWVSPHDQHLLAMGLAAVLFPDDPKVRREIETFYFQQEQMKGTQLSQQTGEKILNRLRVFMVGQEEAALLPLSLLNNLPPDFKKTVSQKIWEEAKKRQALFINREPSNSEVFYGIMTILGAEELLPEKKEEIESYKERVKSGISVEKIMQNLKFGDDPTSANWQLLELAFVALAFPELQSQMRFDEDFWSNVKDELQMYTNRMESLFATEVAFAATVLAKIPQQKMAGQQPLPQRLVA